LLAGIGGTVNLARSGGTTAGKILLGRLRHFSLCWGKLARIAGKTCVVARMD
jgi:hypothetical protein